MKKDSPKLAGLVRYRAERQERNSLALREVVARLKVERPNDHWSYSEICSKAQLKSQNAIHAVWNRDIKSEVDGHNKELNSLPEQAAVRRIYPKTLAPAAATHADSDLSKALHQLAISDAEVCWLVQECDNLKKINARLEKKLQSVTSELNQLIIKFRGRT